MINTQDELVHYGVKGMRWGVRKNPSRAFAKSATKAKRLTKKLDRTKRIADKKNAKLKKYQRRYAGWGLRPSNKAFLAATKAAARWDRKVSKRSKKLDKWLNNMEKEFSSVKVSDISKADLDVGREYIKYLSSKK